jgi:DNA-binding SARP family transcriptional activator
LIAPLREERVISTLNVYLLGGFRLLYDGIPVTTVNTSRLQSLLAYLILHRHAPQSRHFLAFLLWPNSTEAQAHTNLRTLVYRLRHALPVPDPFLHANTQTLQWLSNAPFTLDVADFENAISLANSSAALKKAVDLYRGDLLPGCYDDWILPEREYLRQTFGEALERLLLLLEGEQDYPTAIHYAHRLLWHDPLHETTYRHLMLLHTLNGDRADALRVYQTCVTVLQRELAVEPSQITCDLYERLCIGK